MKNTFFKSLAMRCMFTFFICGGIFCGARAQYSQASWRIGVAGGANFNMYRGSTEQLSPGMIAPSAFHDGHGVGLFAGPVIEYHRARSVFGFMLQAGYDNRRAEYDQVLNSSNRTQDLTTKLSYITVEPSLRIAPFRSAFYLFLGPRVAFNVQKSFTYELGPDPAIPASTSTTVTGDLDDIRQTVFSGQGGIGYDIWLSSRSSRSQVILSPFVAYHPHFGQDPQNDKSWELSTVR
ncbi:MAG TPA: porin family protein, partial [Ferruginibacter sp.]|nr:porin family protein [Ferruginibacter sp.]